MGKTRDLFKQMRDTKGILHAKMGSIKDRYGMDLRETKDIKKRWQEYTEELHKKDLHDPDNHDGVVTHLEPDILESEVAQSCPTLSDPMDCSLPGSSIHGIFQARVLEWGAIALSKEYTEELYRRSVQKRSS